MKKAVKDYIRTIVDFPHEGILFCDVTTLFADPRGFRMCVDLLQAPDVEMLIAVTQVAKPVDPPTPAVAGRR
jgi:adenine phosphoribosyltransferase